MNALDDVARDALDGTAVLFLGAGVSFLSQNESKRALPNGEQLSHEFHDKCGIARGKFRLERISEHFAQKHGSDALYDWLTSLLTVTAVDADLRDVLRLPWMRIYTTNYDNAVEYSRSGMHNPQPLTLDDKPEQVPAGATVHINGSIRRISPSNISQTLTLTDSSYAASKFSGSAWAGFFRSDLRAAKSVVFLGYSLADLDVARILLADPYLSRKTHFIIAPDADEIECGALRPYGSVHATGYEAFVASLRRISHDYVRPARIETFGSLTELHAKLNEGGPSEGTAVYEQLVYGTAPIDRILTDTPLYGDTKYLVNRDAIIDVIDKIRTGPWRDVVITGEIASGKSLAAIQLAKHFLGDGYRVFFANDLRTLESDLRGVSRIQSKVCVILDGYRPYLDALRTYAPQRPSTHRLILTERYTTHDLFDEVVEAILQPSATATVVLERLSESEIAHFGELINFAGLWGEQAGLSATARTRYISTKRESSLYRLLLEVISSQKVQRDISQLLSPVRDDESALRFFTTSFISNVLGYRFWINDWLTFYGIDDVRSLMRRYSAHLSHFISTDSESVNLRSGVMSAYLLGLMSPNEIVVDCLVDMYEYANADPSDPELRRMTFDLMKYSAVEPLFSGKEKLTSILNYYEEVRKIGSVRNNPDYWLQYGIAATIGGYLDRAQTAFDNAYARERARAKPNMTRIDNYFSRFEMQQAIETGDPAQAFKLFKSGSDRLTKQIFLNNNRHYPFKTGRAFTDIAAKHFDLWDESQKKTFLEMCKSIRSKALKWNADNKSHNPDVDILIAETGKLIANLSRTGTDRG